MATALGKLAAALVLDTAEWTVGTENAKRAAAEAATSVDRSMRDLERGVKGTLGNLAAAFAAGFGLNALKNQFEAFVALRAELEKMSVTTGASVQSLSILGQAARLAGTDMGTLEAAMVKMTKGLSASNADTKDTARALEYLGVSGRDAFGQLRDPGNVMLDIAKKLGTMEDGANKTAIALALFGKSGAQMLPTLKEIAETGDLVAKVTADQARQAHDLEVAWTRLQVASAASGKTVMNEFVVPLTALFKALTDAATGADGLNASLKKLKEEGSLKSWVDDMIGGVINVVQVVLILGANIKFVFETIGKDIARGIENVQLIAKGDWAGSQRLGELFRKDAADARAALDETEKRILHMRDTYLSAVKTLSTPPRESLRALEWHMANPDPGFKGTDHVSRAAVDVYAAENAALDQQIAKLKGVGELEAYIEKIQKDRYVTLTPAQRRELIDKEKILLQLEHEKVLRDELLKSDKASLEFQQKLIDIESDYTAALASESAQRAFDITLIGKTAGEIEKLTAFRKADLALQAEAAKITVDAGDQLSADQIAALRRLVALNDLYKANTGLLIDNKTVLQDQLKVWDQVSQKAGAFFGDLVMNGASAFTKLRAELKTFVQDLLALFAQKWVLQMVAGVTGSSALGASAASAGANTLGGSALNALGLGGGSMIDALGLGGGAFAGAAGAGFSAGLSTLGIAASAGASAVGGFTAVLGAAVPVIGWIVAAGALLYSVFGSKGGGPKDGGSFNESFSATGASLGATGNRFFTPSGQDASLATAGRGTAASYFAALRALGGTAPGNVTFGLGYDTDPSGTAPNRISSGVSVNGQTVFGSQDRSIGRDNAQIAPQLQLEASRMLLAALKASQLPDYLKTVFDGLTPSTATQAQIDGALQQAAALKSIFDVVTRNPMKDIAAAMDAQLNPLQSALKNNATVIATAIGAYDKTAASTQNLATATTSYYNAQLQLIAGIQQAKAAIDDMFGATFRNIQIAGLKDNQAKYNFYQQDAAELQRQALASSDPATIQRLTGIINQDIAAAFSLLTPTEQQAQSGAFLARGKDTQAAIDARLEKIAKDAADATQKTLDKIKDLISAGAEAQTNAANTQVTAANTNLAAATTPRQLIILLPNGQQQVTSFG